MQVSIKKNRLKEIIKEEVENFKFIEVRGQTTDSKIKSAIAEELKAVFESVDEDCNYEENNEKLDEIVTDEIAKAVEEGFAKDLGPFSSYEDLEEKDAKHDAQHKTADNLPIGSYYKKSVKKYHRDASDGKTDQKEETNE